MWSMKYESLFIVFLFSRLHFNNIVDSIQVYARLSLRLTMTSFWIILTNTFIKLFKSQCKKWSNFVLWNRERERDQRSLFLFSVFTEVKLEIRLENNNDFWDLSLALWENKSNYSLVIICGMELAEKESRIIMSWIIKVANYPQKYFSRLTWNHGCCRTGSKLV